MVSRDVRINTNGQRTAYKDTLHVSKGGYLSAPQISSSLFVMSSFILPVR
jgi:hypothetical protein